MVKNTCRICHKEEGTENHKCPYMSRGDFPEEEIPECNCCKYCAHECEMEQ